MEPWEALQPAREMDSRRKPGKPWKGATNMAKQPKNSRVVVFLTPLQERQETQVKLDHFPND